MRSTARWAAFAAAVLLPACGGGGGGGGVPVPSPQPDFSIVDTNAASTTFNQNVSPRQFMGKISAYYFAQGH